MTRRRHAVGAPEGGLVVDKPAGMTSHDVVAAVRRALGQPRVGHTGTLDPMATGVLPLLLGRATRLAQFLASATKTYLATVRFGTSTTTYDAEGDPSGPVQAVRLDAGTVDALLERFRGPQQQVPPAISAKKVGGERAYRLARADAPPRLAPVAVEVFELTLISCQGAEAEVRVTASPGYYVRSLAHDLGEALGVGAHLSALRRERSGPFTLADALPLAEVLRDPGRALDRLVPPAALLPDLPQVPVDAAGAEHVARGRAVAAPSEALGRVRLVDGSGRLLALAEGRGRLLHPFLVLV